MVKRWVIKKLYYTNPIGNALVCVASLIYQSPKVSKNRGVEFTRSVPRGNVCGSCPTFQDPRVSTFKECNGGVVVRLFKMCIFGARRFLLPLSRVIPGFSEQRSVVQRYYFRLLVVGVRSSNITSSARVFVINFICWLLMFLVNLVLFWKGRSTCFTSTW